MKKILILISSILISTSLMAAGGDGGGGSSGNANSYDDAVKLVKRAGKIREKGKNRKSKKTLFSSIRKIRESL